MKQTSGFAVASIILGVFSILLGWFPIIGELVTLLAIVFGVLGIRACRRGKKGLVLAIIGLALGVLMAFILISLFAFTIMVFNGLDAGALPASV